MPTVLITGGHGGIGFECAKELASRYHVNLLLAGRSPEKMSGAAETLKKSGVKVSLLPLDTSSLASVRAAAAQCKTMLDSGEIDGLQAILCNAGGRFEDVTYSSDGYETTFATNVLGHLVLVELLIDRVAPDGRVLFTASGTHDPATIDGRLVGKAVEPNAVALANTGKNAEKAISAGKRYTTSKLCNVMEAYELARRLSAHGSTVTANAFDPGAVSDSGFLRGQPGFVRWLFNSALMKWFSRQIGITEGDLKFSGASLARLAVDPEFKGASGKYFQSNALKLSEVRSSQVSYDEALARKLWDDSRQLAQLQPSEGAPLLR